MNIQTYTKSLIIVRYIFGYSLKIYHLNGEIYVWFKSLLQPHTVLITITQLLGDHMLYLCLIGYLIVF